MAEPRDPAYVAIVTDGNGRWAQARGLSVADGHRAGAENVRERLRDAAELGIRELTVYAFSTENWSRPREEVTYLIALIGEYIDRVTPELDAQNVRLRFIGERGDPVPADLVGKMEWAEELTGDNDLMTLYRALQLRRAGGDRAAPRALSWGHRGGLPGRALRAGYERLPSC